MSGIKQSSAGYPTGINRKGFSFCGLFKIELKKFIVEGVRVRATKSAF